MMELGLGASKEEERILVVATSAGKVFGISTHGGKVMWSREAGSSTPDWTRRVMRLNETNIAVVSSSQWKTLVLFVDPWTGNDAAAEFLDRTGIVMAMPWKETLVAFLPDSSVTILPQDSGNSPPAINQALHCLDADAGK